MIARVTADQPSTEKARRGDAGPDLEMSSCTPMTPVDATSTCRARIRACAAAVAVSRGGPMPTCPAASHTRCWHDGSRATPGARLWRETHDAHTARLVVKTAAADTGPSAATSAGFAAEADGFDAAIPGGSGPPGVVTPPSAMSHL